MASSLALRRALRQDLRLGMVEEVGTEATAVGEEVFGEAAAAGVVSNDVAAAEGDVAATFAGSEDDEETAIEVDPIVGAPATLFAPLVASSQNVMRRLTW